MSENSMPSCLVIDDDDQVSASLVEALTDMGYNATSRRGGVVPHGFTPDVVICDYDLGMYDPRNGAQICEDLRVTLPNARFIICSGLPREVPDFVEFFSKADVIELLGSLEIS